MTQTRWQSLHETIASTAIGFAVSWAATPPILAMFGIEVGGTQSLGITAVFTVLSLARGWVVRRGFNHLHGSAK
jgi:hypothetical protein